MGLSPNKSILLPKKSEVQKYHKKQICSSLKLDNIQSITKVKRVEVVAAIIYKLQTGRQWRNLPMHHF